MSIKNNEDIVLNDMKYRLAILMDETKWYHKRFLENEEKMIALKEVIASLENEL